MVPNDKVVVTIYKWNALLTALSAPEMVIVIDNLLLLNMLT